MTLVAIGVAVPGVLMCILMLWRNSLVYRYRMRLLEQVALAAQADIFLNRQPFEWRYDALNSESYDRMLWCFWRRIDSFYPDRTFLDPSAIHPFKETQK